MESAATIRIYALASKRGCSSCVASARIGVSLPATGGRDLSCGQRRLVSGCSNAGFTLIELIITVAMASILLTVAVPSFQGAMRTNSIASLTNELTASLQLARSEAVTRGSRVTVCKSANIAEANPTCSTSANWQDGWLVFVDSGTKGTLDGSDLRLKVRVPSNNIAVINGDANFANFVSYLPTGVSDGGNVASGKINISIASDQRCVDINNSGRIHIMNAECS
jgi:type IV fimbrial biogenesis protein FimT